MHLGAYMKGGSIEVTGNVSDWLGGEMTNGFIRVAGNAGGQVGAAYRGSRGGMRDGTILVGGTAGLEVGDAHETRDHRRRRAGQGLRRAGDEGRDASSCAAAASCAPAPG